MNKFLGVYESLVDLDTNRKVSAFVRFKGGGTKPPDQTQQIAAERASLENTNRLLAMYEQTFAPYEKELLYSSMGVVNPERVEAYSEAFKAAKDQEESLRVQKEKAGEVLIYRNGPFTKEDLNLPKEELIAKADEYAKKNGVVVSRSNTPKDAETAGTAAAGATFGFSRGSGKAVWSPRKLYANLDAYLNSAQKLAEVKTIQEQAIEARNAEIETQRKNTVAAQTGITLKQGDEIAKSSIAQAEDIQQRQTERYGIAGSSLTSPLKDSKTLAETTAKVGSTNIALEGGTANREGLRLAALGLGAPHSGAAQTLQNQGLAYNQASQNWANYAAQQGQNASLAYGNMWGNIGRVAGYGLGAAYNQNQISQQNQINSSSVPGIMNQISAYRATQPVASNGIGFEGRYGGN